MDFKTNQNQIVIKAIEEDRKGKLPLNVLFPMVLGTLTGIALIFGLLIVV